MFNYNSGACRSTRDDAFNWADISKAYEFIYAGYDLHNFREYDLGSVLQYGLSVC